MLTSKLVDVVRFEKLDLLHVHYAIPHASAAYMAQQILSSQGIKNSVYNNTSWNRHYSSWEGSSFEPVITFSINKSNAVTAVSNSLKEDTLNQFDIKNKIEVIPNFICFEEYQLPNNEKYKKRLAPNGEYVITHVSNFRKVKRIQDVVIVFKNLLKTHPSKLVMVGDGPERNKIEMLCREHLPTTSFTFREFKIYY